MGTIMTPVTTTGTTVGALRDAYATVNELKRVSADAFASSTSYDSALAEMLTRASRLIDKLCNRIFFPEVKTIYLNGPGARDLWIPDLLAITSVSISSDDGATFTALAAADYLKLGGDNVEYDKLPYSLLRLDDHNGDYAYWYAGLRTAKIVGIWGYHDDYANAWEDTQDTVENTPNLASGATSITVNDADGADLDGVTSRFQVGHLLLVESEQFRARAVNTSTNALTVTGAQHGTTAAAHATNTAIYRWRPTPIVQQATIMQALRWFKRGQQAFTDTGGVVELGTLLYTKKLDPEIETMLLDSGLRRRR